MTDKKALSEKARFGILSAAVFVLIVFVVFTLSSGRFYLKGSTILQSQNPMGFNVNVGTAMLITAGAIIYWYILLLRMLRQRRDAGSNLEDKS